MSDNQESQEATELKTENFSEVELQAIDMGWRPKEEWNGSEDDFIDAKSFVRNKSLFDKINSLGKRIKDQESTISMLKEHHSKVEEATRAQVITELKRAKKTALEEGDADKVIEIDDAIAQQRAIETFEKSQAKQQPEGLHPEFTSWVERNTWYAQDSELREEADVLGFAYKQRNPNKEPNEVLDYVSKQVKKLYPEKFKNPNRSAPSMVEGTNKQKGKTESDGFVLTEEEERVMKNFVRNGIMSKEDYVKEIKKVRGA